MLPERHAALLVFSEDSYESHSMVVSKDPCWCTCALEFTIGHEHKAHVPKVLYWENPIGMDLGGGAT